jgi:hypothetical protein
MTWSSSVFGPSDVDDKNASFIISFFGSYASLGLLCLKSARLVFFLFFQRTCYSELLYELEGNSNGVAEFAQ